MLKLPDNLPLCTVRELTADIKAVLETGFGSLWVVGEMSSLARPASGHLYFNLKDQEALIRTVVWRSAAQRLSFAPQDGLEVIGRGRLTVYPPRGDYQLVLDELYPKGMGLQDQALRKLKERLAKLGYFEPARKKPIPKFPKRIVLVTSPSGAAVRDMLEILARRWPIAEVWIAPTRVQGEGAAISIASVLKFLNRLPNIDVILLGRGGGSSEDLSAFNDEIVAKAIFESKTPIISAVGHEVDVTIADLVADRRALTPSEAAEIATPDRDELLQQLRQRRLRLMDLLRNRVTVARQRLEALSERRVLREPLDPIHLRQQRLDDVQARLVRGIRQRVQDAERRSETLAAALHSLSPLNVLARGYSLTRTRDDRQLVRSAGQISAGAALEILLPDGIVDVRVESVRESADPLGNPP